MIAIHAPRPSLPLFALLVLASASHAAAGSLADIKKAQRLRVVAPAAEIPFEGDVLRGFARSLGVELRIEAQPDRAAALQALREGRADVAAGGLVSPRDRREGVVLSGEVFPTRFVALNRAPAASPSFIEALRNASRILAPAATGAADAVTAAKLPGFKTDTALTPDKVPAGLRADPASVAVVGLFDALVARRTDPALQVGIAFGARESVAFAVRQVDADLLAALNGHLAQLRSSPSYRMVVARGLGDDALSILSRAHLEETR